ncbi:unnamed protein product [Rotaria sp. Silwood2]|nr:unnamed protein product [Rotaria sp. Silwood2]
MFTNNNVMPFDTSIPSLSPNTSSTPLCHHHPIFQSQISSTLHTPSSSSLHNIAPSSQSTMYNAAPPPQSTLYNAAPSPQSTMYNAAPPPQSTLYNAAPSPQSTMYNAAPTSEQKYHCLYPYQPQSQTLLPNEWDLILSLRMMQNLSVLPTLQPLPSPAYSHTGATTSTTALQQLYPQQITYATAQLQQLSTTCASSSLRISVPPVLTQTRSSPLHSGHRNQSPVPQLQAYSPPPVSPPLVIVSPVQQEQKSLNQILSVSLQQHQSTNLQRQTFVQHNPLITEPTIQLCDPTKPQ